MTFDSIITIAAFCCYLIFMLCIGMYFVGKNRTTNEYFLGGRQLGSWVTSMSAQASDMSGWLLMGLPGAAYLSGISAGWIAIGLAIGTYLNWLLVAKRLRQYTKTAGDAITLPQFFKNRFHDESGWISVVAAVFILVFFLFYTASGFVSCAKLFSSVFGIPYMVSLLVGAVVVISYTFAGGFFAVCWTDFFQGILMFFCVLAVPTIAIFSMGGPTEFFSQVEAFNPNFLNMLVDGATGVPYTAMGVISLLAWGLGYFGMPHILLRFMAIEDEKKLVLSRRIATVWVVIAMAASILIGMVGLGMTKAGALEFLSGSTSETLIVRVASLISQHGVLAAILAGLILAGILAATMSTADSQMLAAASSVSQNILQEFAHLKLSEKQSLFAARLTIVCVSVVGVVLARDPNSSVFGIVSFAWAGFGGAFGAVVLCALFWKRCNWQGALAGMLSGGLMVFVWKYLVSPLGGVFGIYELLPAFLVSLAVCVVVSLVTPAPEADILAEFDAAK